MNKRSVDTQKRIETALFQLMQVEKFDSISLTQIAKRAEVSRMSLYRNYKSKEDILKVIFQRLSGQFKLEMTANNLTCLPQLLQGYFNYFRKNPQVVAAITNAGVEGLVLKAQTEDLSACFEYFLKCGQQPSPYAVSYYSGAVFAVLILWNQQNYEKPVAEIVARLARIIGKELNEFKLIG
ncbi:TetR/AcrR family transcriptional regulator [Liquorilactobacillus satsumensis]|uniref:TetR/AcrR family transcriptional regulator n=1 Tax=Liquorilactobacillus satsumensis TaxID=259059 RepID=UPI0039E98C30